MNWLQVANLTAFLSVAAATTSLWVGPTEPSSELLASRVAGLDHYKCMPLAGWSCHRCAEDNPNSFHHCTVTQDLSLCQSSWGDLCTPTTFDCGNFMDCDTDDKCIECTNTGACPSPSCTVPPPV